MSIKLPRLLDQQLREVARLSPSKVSVTLKMEPLNTASMTLPDGEPTVNVGDFVELFLPGKSAGIFRAASVSRDYVTGSQSVKLEHGLVTMGDAIVPGEHIFYGYDGGDMAVTGYVAVAGWSNQYSSQSYSYMGGRNKDGSAFAAVARCGTVLPMVVKNDKGFQILYNAETAAIAPTAQTWDGKTTLVSGRSAELIACTPYSNATGTVIRDTTVYMRPKRNMGTFGSLKYGARVTVHGAANEGEGLYYAVETSERTVTWPNDWTSNGRTTTTCWVPAAMVELDPGYIIGEDTTERPNQFQVVADALIASAHKQDTYWAFGESDFDESYGYKFEDVNLLTAILSLPEKLNGQYRWEFDQSATPWRLNMRRLDESNLAELRLNRNLTKLSISVDATDLVTCVLPIGADGLTIEQLTGSRYIVSENMGTYWHAEQTVNTTDTDDQELYENALTYLKEHDTPTVSVSVSALDLCEMTGEPLDALEIGKMCRVPLPTFGTSVNEYITQLTWSDVYGAPERVSVTLANRMETASGMLAKLMRK